MAGSEDRPARCRGCGTQLAGKTTVDVTVSHGDERRTTVLCEDCATVECASCGHAVPIATALASLWRAEDRYQCVKCGASVPSRDVVELRHETNKAYRKLVCSECLPDVPIPPNIRVRRDLP
jgi:DNA-directed RNA polymerase subunit RPC12/RpoP